MVAVSGGAATFGCPARARARRLALRAGPNAEIPAGRRFALRAADHDGFRDGSDDDGDFSAKGSRATRWTVAGTAVAAGAVFVLDCGDCAPASCRTVRLEAFAPAGTDAGTLGLDFSVAKFAAKPSFPPLVSFAPNAAKDSEKDAAAPPTPPAARRVVPCEQLSSSASCLVICELFYRYASCLVNCELFYRYA